MYTINGKEYSGFDINKRCAEIMLIGHTAITNTDCPYIASHMNHKEYDPCNYQSDTWPIIEKCWDELNESILRNGGLRKSHWQDLMHKHNCTKLAAACICLIECYGGEL